MRKNRKAVLPIFPEEIAAAAGADVVGKMAVLAEGDAASRTDISYLEKLPLFNGKGEPLPFD